MAKSIDEPPRRRELDEIDMELVDEAKRIRNRRTEVPVGAAALELVRYLRAIGEFDGGGYTMGTTRGEEADR